MTSTEIRIPLTEIRVKFRASTKRPVTELDRMVMQAIAAGANSVDSLNFIFQIGERLLVECLVDLMDLAFLALDTGGSGFRLTEFGKESLEKGLTSFGERLDDTDEITFLREDLEGRIAPGQIIWYGREEGDIDPVVAASVISHGEIEKLLIQKLKKDGMHLHSVESILPVSDHISFKVTVNNGAISGLPNQWNHLKPLLQIEAGKRMGIGQATSPRDLENEQDDLFEVEVSLDVSDLLLKASDHEEALARAIEQAHSHILILSAHASEAVLNKLNEPIKAAIQRGVRVDVLFGLPSLDEGGEPHAKTTKKWLQEIRKSFSGGGGNYLTVNEEPLHSDAKILVWDAPDGSYQAILGSYNWLYGLDSLSFECLGSEVGIRLNDSRLVGNICTTLSGWLDAGGHQLNAVALRWRNIGRTLAQKEPSPASGDDAAVSKVRIIYDESHAGVLREGLVHASKRFLVSSHKLNRSATGNANKGGGKLDWLERRNPVPDFQFVLVTGREPKVDSWIQDDKNRLEELVKRVGGSIRLGKGTHARVLVYDDVAVVSGYNFLSTTQDKRQVGVVIRGAGIANKLWNTFKTIDV